MTSSLGNYFFVFSNQIERLLLSLDVPPSSYSFFFPPDIESKIQDMVDDKVFPTIASLAPSIAFAVLLGITRLLLQTFFFRVCMPHLRMIRLADCASFEIIKQPIAIYLMKIRLTALEPVILIEKLLPRNRKATVSQSMQPTVHVAFDNGTITRLPR